jgi:hypothetical protein
MERKDSLACSHQPTTCPCPEPDESIFDLHKFILSVATNGCKFVLVNSHDGTTKGTTGTALPSLPLGLDGDG